MDEAQRTDGETAGQVVEELKKVAFASIGDVAQVIDADDWLEGIPARQLPAVAAIRIKQGSGGMERDVKMYDKLKALEMLAKINGMFTGGGEDAEDAPVIVDDLPRGDAVCGA